MAREAENGLTPWEGRAIMLVDLDAFFASVEQHDHPEWRGKPVIVGGAADRRGVVSTASYEARAFGVHSAMPSSTARRLCPDAIWTSGNFSRYREMSGKVMAILSDETPFMQQVSIDEAFLDVTPTAHNREHPVLIARRIKERVSALGITCSVGLGASKSVAKIASDADKPDGLTVVYPGGEAAYLAPLPIRTMSGIGAVAERKLHAYGIKTLGDVARASHSILAQVFGSNAEMMRARCLGQDESPVAADDSVKSVSGETSFARSITTRADIVRAMSTMAAKVCRRLRKKGLKARTFTLKVRHEDLKVRTAQTRLDAPTDDEFAVADALDPLIDALWKPGMPLRLVGVAASGFDDDVQEAVQDSLFDLLVEGGDEGARSGENAGAASGNEGAETAAGTGSAHADSRGDGGTGHRGSAGGGVSAEERHARLIAATDRIRDRFGERAVNYGRESATLDFTTGTAAKNPEDYK